IDDLRHCRRTRFGIQLHRVSIDVDLVRGAMAEKPPPSRRADRAALGPCLSVCRATNLLRPKIRIRSIGFSEGSDRRWRRDRRDPCRPTHHRSPLQGPIAIGLTWLFAAETALDLANSTIAGINEHLFETAAALTWLILTFYVPILWISLGL